MAGQQADDPWAVRLQKTPVPDNMVRRTLRVDLVVDVRSDWPDDPNYTANMATGIEGLLTLYDGEHDPWFVRDVTVTDDTEARRGPMTKLDFLKLVRDAMAKAPGVAGADLVPGPGSGEGRLLITTLAGGRQEWEIPEEAIRDIAAAAGGDDE